MTVTQLRRELERAGFRLAAWRRPVAEKTELWASPGLTHLVMIDTSAPKAHKAMVGWTRRSIAMFADEATMEAPAPLPPPGPVCRWTYRDGARCTKTEGLVRELCITHYRRARESGQLEQIGDVANRKNRHMNRPLNPNHLPVLRLICQCPGLGPSEIARTVGLLPKNVKGIIHQLRTRGFVADTTNDTWGQAHATDKGRKAAGAPTIQHEDLMPVEVTKGQLQTLEALHAHPGADRSAIANARKFKMSSLSQELYQLRKLGLVAPDDTVTPIGLQLLQNGEAKGIDFSSALVKRGKGSTKRPSTPPPRTPPPPKPGATPAAAATKVDKPTTKVVTEDEETPTMDEAPTTEVVKSPPAAQLPMPMLAARRRFTVRTVAGIEIDCDDVQAVTELVKALAPCSHLGYTGDTNASPQ